MGARADDYKSVMEVLARDALAAYRDLVYETPGFNRYFQESTPIREIAGLNIGSRPSSRKQSDLIEDLRAIPWVFSWSVNRAMIPGLVWLRHSCRGVRPEGGARGEGTWTPPGNASRMAVHADTALEHGYGAGQD